MIKAEQIIWENNLDEKVIDLEGKAKSQIVICFDKAGEKELEFVLKESGSQLELLLVYIGKGATDLSLKVKIAHLAEQTQAKVKMKALLWDKSVLNFTGNVWVGPEAHGTDTFLKCESLLMSPQAVSKTIPSMEIIANDVKAGHAATFGRVDDESLFYLESRGIDKATAERMLLEAFLAEERSFFTNLTAEGRENLGIKLLKLAD